MEGCGKRKVDGEGGRLGMRMGMRNGRGWREGGWRGGGIGWVGGWREEEKVGVDSIWVYKRGKNVVDFF